MGKKKKSEKKAEKKRSKKLRKELRASLLPLAPKGCKKKCCEKYLKCEKKRCGRCPCFDLIKDVA